MTPASDGRPLVVAHHHPGRLRMRSPAFETDERLRDAAQRWLRDQCGVRAVDADARTGSLLVTYDPALVDAGELLLAVATRSQLTIAEHASRPVDVQFVFDGARALDERVLEATGGRFGLRVVLPALLGVGSAGSFLLSEQRTPRWESLLYWAVQAFTVLNTDERARWSRNGGTR